MHRPRGALRHIVHRRGFTILELLIVIGIIAILFSIFSPTIGRVREASRRTQCASNLRTLTIASLSYAADEPQRVLFNNPEKNDDLTYLFPRYLTDAHMKICVCPSTDNVVTTRQHLTNNAKGGHSDATGGHSYELRSTVDAGITFPDGFMSTRKVAKALNMFREPARVFILTDADDQGTNNWPDVNDNHRADGWNVAYLDGHVEWTPRGKPILEAFMRGYYDPNLPNTIYQQYGLVKSGSTFSWK